MNENSNSPIYDLEERTFQFTKKNRIWVKSLTNTISNIEDIKQLIRASGSVGANYIEANESLGKKDFVFRIKICRKEAKECGYWLRLILETNNDIRDEKTGNYLLNESIELKKIFSSMIGKSN